MVLSPATNNPEEDAVTNSHSSVVYPPSIDFATLNDTIRNARTIAEFVATYDRRPFQLCLKYMIVSSSMSGAETTADWAKEWAIRMRQQEEPWSAADSFINHCRQTTLLLLYELMNHWKEGLITAQDICQKFKGHRFVNILQHSLYLDQAKCLYTMQLPGQQHGMDWVAEPHQVENPQWQQLVAQVGGWPTMDHRYLLMMYHPSFAGLELCQTSALKELLEPMIHPDIDETTFSHHHHTFQDDMQE